ncbi:MAG: tol-pal system protein YbgF [Rickettsiaceae bacterium]|nr:tol-pal system protein YbgF [Rickettsiaceae bacterium]
MKIKKRFIALVMLTMFSNFCLAEDTIYTRDINPEDMNEVYQDRTMVLEKQLRYLINEMELLKQELDIIKNKIIVLEGNKEAVAINGNSENLEPKDVNTAREADSKVNAKDKITALENKSEQEFYDDALNAFKTGDFEFSTNAFNVFVTKYPNSALLSNAYYWLGESYAKKNILGKAVLSYIQGSQKQPNGKKALDSLLKAAECFSKLKKSKDACIILQKITVAYPNRPAAVNKRIEELRDTCGCR